MADIDINLSSMGLIFGVWLGQTFGVPKWTIHHLGGRYLVVVPSYDVSCALILLSGFYGLDFMADIDINTLSKGPIFGVWIGPTLGVPK